MKRLAICMALTCGLSLCAVAPNSTAIRILLGPTGTGLSMDRDDVEMKIAKRHAEEEAMRQLSVDFNKFVAAMSACSEHIKSGRMSRGKHNPCDGRKLVRMLDGLTRSDVWPK